MFSAKAFGEHQVTNQSLRRQAGTALLGPGRGDGGWNSEGPLGPPGVEGRGTCENSSPLCPKPLSTVRVRKLRRPSVRGMLAGTHRWEVRLAQQWSRVSLAGRCHSHRTCWGTRVDAGITQAPLRRHRSGVGPAGRGAVAAAADTGAPHEPLPSRSPTHRPFRIGNSIKGGGKMDVQPAGYM